MHFWSRTTGSGGENKRFIGAVALGGAVISGRLILKYSSFCTGDPVRFSFVKYFAAGVTAGWLWGYCDSLMEQKYLHTINEVKFVKYSNKPCRGHVYSMHDCTEASRLKDPSFTCSYAVMRWMIDVLDSAQETLDLALYLATSKEFKDAIMRMHKRGVRIRIVTDHVMSQGTASVVPLCIAAGIPVRMNDKEKMMHRKSALIDNRVVLIGTGNWTMQALAGNFEMWVLTSDPPVLQGVREAFEHQWTEEGVIEPTLEQFKEFAKFIN